MTEVASIYRVSVPALPPTYLVCCHCKREVKIHQFCCNNHWVKTYHCSRCGDVVPIHSAVVNGRAERPDWSAA